MLPFFKNCNNYHIENNKFRIKDESRYESGIKFLVNIDDKVATVFAVGREADLSICINIESKEVYFSHFIEAEVLGVFDNLGRKLNKFFHKTIIDNTEDEYVVVIKEFIRVLEMIFELVENIPVGNSATKRALFFN